MTGQPIIWQQELAEISTPDGGDTYLIKIKIGGELMELAMSRQLYVAHLTAAIEALAGPEESDDLALLSVQIARHRRSRR